jgi:hypothetical protein
MFTRLFVSAVMIFSVSVVNAATITSLVGDKDGFGVAGLDAVPVDGTETGYGWDNRTTSDPEFTDVWGYTQNSLPSPIVYDHTYDLSGYTAVSAILNIQDSGMGDGTDRTWEVLFNGASVGTIGPNKGGTTSFINSFIIDVLLLTGNDTITLNYLGPNGAEGYAINFSELTIQANPVPVPAAVWLFGSGLLGLMGFNSKRKKTA